MRGVTDKMASSSDVPGMGVISPRKRMAMGDAKSGADGVQGLSSMQGKMHMDIKGGKTKSRILRDGKRNKPVRHSMGRGQANPNHGPWE